MSGGVGALAGRETAKGGCIAGCPAEGDEDVFEGAVIDGTVDRPVAVLWMRLWMGLEAQLPPFLLPDRWMMQKREQKKA